MTLTSLEASILKTLLHIGNVTSIMLSCFSHCTMAGVKMAVVSTTQRVAHVVTAADFFSCPLNVSLLCPMPYNLK